MSNISPQRSWGEVNKAKERERETGLSLMIIKSEQKQTSLAYTRKGLDRKGLYREAIKWKQYFMRGRCVNQKRERETNGGARVEATAPKAGPDQNKQNRDKK
ncbi:hypothetical protein EVAR_15692_1 [Eumeta japonica]|uniref:Uncharacterized protein n=1 Tax=Eumeta variegata TaxID=151549 RepID=A0A4C1U9N6_EUMVA|nr:hypothetical protein EVAR_15692_1 [Eumeta japonica]